MINKGFISNNTNGERIRVGQIEPGEFFGEMSLLTGEPRTASIVAGTDVIGHEITKDHMRPAQQTPRSRRNHQQSSRPPPPAKHPNPGQRRRKNRTNRKPGSRL